MMKHPRFMTTDLVLHHEWPTNSDLHLWYISESFVTIERLQDVVRWYFEISLLTRLFPLLPATVPIFPKSPSSPRAIYLSARILDHA